MGAKAKRKTTPATKAPKFVEAQLHVQGTAATKVVALAKKGGAPAAVRAAILAALGDLVAPSAIPAWLQVETGDGVDDVVHLAAPMFFAAGADGDEFFHEFPKARVVVDHRGKARSYPKGGYSEGAAITIGDRDVAKVDSYATDADAVLTDIDWIDAVPKTRREFAKLLKTAGDVLFGELAGYDAKDFSPEAASERAAPVATGGPEALFLASASRDARYADAGPRATPKIAWRTDWLGEGSEWGGSPVVGDGVVYAAGGNRAMHVVALDPRGKLLWQWKAPGTEDTWGQICVGRGLVFVGSFRAFYCIDATSGALRWKAGLTKLSRGGSIVVGDRLYVATAKGVFGLDLATGRKKFTFVLKKSAMGSPAHRDGILYVRGDQKLFAIDLATGKARWTAKAAEYDVSQAGPTLVDDLVLFPGPAGALAAADAATGKIRWAMKRSDETDLGNGTLAVADGKAIYRSDSGFLVAVDVRTGKVAWTYGVTKKPYGIGNSSPIVAGDTVYCSVVLSEDDSRTVVVGVDLATGKERWRFDGVKKDEALSWYCTPAVVDGKLLVQAYGLIALK